MTNLFHIADFENAFWSITPGVAFKHPKASENEPKRLPMKTRRAWSQSQEGERSCSFTQRKTS